MEISNIITIIVYVLSIGVSWGVITNKVSKQAEEIKALKNDNKITLDAIKAENKLSLDALRLESKSGVDALRAETKASIASLEKTNDIHMESLRDLVNQRLQTLEAKQDKHNNLIERMTVVEQSTKAAWKSIDRLNEENNTTHRIVE